MEIEIKPYKWKEHGRTISADFFPFIDNKPRHDLANCEKCIYFLPESDCQKSSDLDPGKLYLFCGPICGHFMLRPNAHRACLNGDNAKTHR